ncbi:type 4a pilus biogenesis protein PilO [Myxococcota bacterium]
MEKVIERWAKIPSRQRHLLIGLVLLGLIAGYWYLFHSDLAAKIGRAEKEYRSHEAQRAEKQAYVDNLAKYEARLNELQQDLNLARAQLPDQAEDAQLLAQLGNKGRQSGLMIDRFQPQGEKQKDFVAEIAFAMDVRGSYHEIATFIDSIGKLDRIVNVTDISMTTPSTENQKVVVKGQFILKTYRFVGNQKKPEKESKKKKKKGRRK